MKAAVPVALLTEKEWAAQVAALARALGWRRYHTYRSERSQPGFPDEVLVRDRIVYLELKTQTGRLSEPQREWLTALTQAGGEAYIARPADLQQLARVLQARGTDLTSLPAVQSMAALTREELRVPAD